MALIARPAQAKPPAAGLAGGVGGTVAGRAFVFGDQQHFAAVNVAGSLTNLSWSPSAGVVRPDWGGAVLTGKAVGYVHDGLQHVFARGVDNTLRHWYQNGSAAPGLDNWGTAGRVMSDPTGFAYRNQQHVFYRTHNGTVEHRFFDDPTGRVNTDNWGGNIS
jgi:hypothetical protein